ncbi:MAG TPA: DNA-3-methyladenine glycosylase I [Coriobacteriia bacterium]
MHAPERIEPTGLSDYLAVMSRSVFEPGLNWQVVESKWPGIVEAFEGFDPMRVAAYTPEDVDRLLGDPGVIRNRAKIEAVVHNAGEMLALVRDYLRSEGSYDELAADLKKRFKFVGGMGAYHFLYVVGEQVPPWEQWIDAHPSSHSGRVPHLR